MRIDLHVHSTASDGTLTPLQLIQLAETIGLGALSITDHDSVEGVREALRQPPSPTLNLLTGVEISTNFFPAVGLTLLADIAPSWYLAAFLLLAATSLGAVFSRVPLYLSSEPAMRAVAERLPDRPGLRLIDLGCGSGGLLRHLAGSRPDVSLHGVEAAPLTWLVSRLRLGGRARIRLGSLWDEDLSGYDVVYAYLSPAPMARLWDKARREMRPGSLFISNSFAVPGAEPDEAVQLDDLARGRLLLWRMP